jgi:putative hydrolase of the HAD superfamily
LFGIVDPETQRRSVPPSTSSPGIILVRLSQPKTSLSGTILVVVGKVLFDFDGTLAHRPGMWSQCLVDALDKLTPEHGIVAADFRPHLQDGFPWDRPGEAHLHLSSSETWWESLEPLFARAFVAVGVGDDLAPTAAASVREHYCDATGFELFPDSLRALTALKESGWTLVILSNHVPELPLLVEYLGLGQLIQEVFSSASIGYEKPNPEAFRIALNGARPSDCFMVGDNPRADILGAEAVGLNAILVRNHAADALHVAEDLDEAAELILAS